MEKKNEKASQLLGEISKVLGEDNSLELLHILRKQGRVSEKQWEEMVRVQRQALDKQRLIREAILDAVKALRVKLPDIFDVKVSNQKDFPGSIKISNLEDIKFPGEVGFKKPLWLSDLLAKWVSFPIIKALGKQLQNVNITGPTDPKKAIAVRLSDGDIFYKAVMQVVSAAASNSKLVEDLLQSIFDGHEPLLREPLKTFPSEFLSSAVGVITSQTIITPPTGKKISVKIINASTESSGGVYNLDFLTSAIKVWRYYPGANSSIWQGAVMHIEGAVDEELKFSATGVGNTRKMFLQVGYEFK